MLAPFGRRACRVVANERIGPYDLVAVEDESGPAPLAGQFYMLSAAAGWGGASGRPHLGRAFSVCRARGRRLEFLLEAIGPGTARLGTLAEGEDAWVLGPLGIGFADPTSGGRALLVGGGIGVAPLVIWERTLQERGMPARTLLGSFRNDAFAQAARLFEGEFAVATDDGSGPGNDGLVTDLLDEDLEPGDEVYGCGPPPMLEAVRRICATRSVPAQLALESRHGLRLRGVLRLLPSHAAGLRRLCVDGPVVAARADLEAALVGEH